MKAFRELLVGEKQ